VNALSRIIGSIAFAAACRAAFLVSKDSDNPSRRLFLPLKNNLGTDTGGLAYSVQECDLDTHGVKTSRIVWESEFVAQTADEAMSVPSDPEEAGMLRDAAQFLRNQLAGGPMKSVDIFKAADGAGISRSTLRRAQARIGVQAQRQGGPHGAWYWAISRES
jgi:putative DNA primase/helicase